VQSKWRVAGRLNTLTVTEFAVYSSEFVMHGRDRLIGTSGRSCRFVLCVAALLLVQLSARAADPFEKLNEALREQHANAREREWALRGPVILVEFDKLTLLKGDDRKTVEVLPLQYHRLKSIAHAPLAIYLTMEKEGDSPIGDQQLTRLKDIAARIEAVRAVLNDSDFRPDALIRQREILDRSTTFIANALKTGSANSKDYPAFAIGIRPLIMKNVEEAAELQIRGYDAAVAGWKKSLSVTEWSKLKVVITGSASPRKQNLATQYFAQVLGVSGEGPRLVYAESLYDEAKALKLLNATAVDAKAGLAFFDDSSRLHRDLMADAAAKFLQDHAAELKGLMPASHP
jgi:hypothetical protein